MLPYDCRCICWFKFFILYHLEINMIVKSADLLLWAKNEALSFHSCFTQVELVRWTQSVGLTLVNRDLNSLQLKTPSGQILSFYILQTFPFTSESKRMGIIVRVCMYSSKLCFSAFFSIFLNKGTFFVFFFPLETCFNILSCSLRE